MFNFTFDEIAKNRRFLAHFQSTFPLCVSNSILVNERVDRILSSNHLVSAIVARRNNSSRNSHRQYAFLFFSPRRQVSFTASNCSHSYNIHYYYSILTTTNCRNCLTFRKFNFVGFELEILYSREFKKRGKK